MDGRITSLFNTI